MNTELRDAPVGEPAGVWRPAEWRNDAWDDPDELHVAQTAPKPRRSRFVKWLAFLVGVAVVGTAISGGLFGMWLIRQVNPPGDAAPSLTFVVDEDDDLVAVAARLKAQGFITHAGVFEWYVKRKGGVEFEPGYYTLRPRDTMGNLVKALRTPPAETFTPVTFPEGYTIEQMSRRLSEKVPRLSPAKFVDATADGEVRSAYQPSRTRSLEGLLFPDTFQVSNGETERQVVARMVRLMERVGRQEGLDDQLKRRGLSEYEVLIVASMIEREAKFDADRPKIARVIYNRLEIGMPLQIDATLLYRQDPDTPFSVLKRKDTPYNTYLNDGLPPTPIANPGRASIRAALNPAVDPSPGDPICRGLAALEPCRYLFYVVSDADGNHAFAATLEQHEENVRRAAAAGLLG
jgi:UPF0755 protein